MEIKELPFYFKAHAKPDNGGFPHSLPFKIEYDSKLRMLQHTPTSDVKNILSRVYNDGSLVEGSLSNESGDHYVDKVFNYIKENFKLNKDNSVLEIGYGTGKLLKKLKNEDIRRIVGIEPGKHEHIEGLDDVLLINDFYPSNKITEKFDLIIHILVLEHIINPIEFIIGNKNQLSKNGRLIFFIPNEQPFIENADLGMFIHEHFNYFTSESIVQLMSSTGLYINDISVIDGLLAVTVSMELKTNDKTYPKINYDYFIFRLFDNIKKISKIIDTYNENDIALYVPGRALNNMFILGLRNVRLVDDNTELHNKYLPYFFNRIESFQEIVNNPPKVIIIFSRTFGNIIKSKCINSLNNTLVYLIDEI